MSPAKKTPVSELRALAAMSPRGVGALMDAGFETAEAAAARSDEELTEIPGFGVESLGRLRQWQRAKKEGVPLVPMPGRRAEGGLPAARGREADEPDLAERLLLELVKSSTQPGLGLANVAVDTAVRFYDLLEARKEKLNGHDGGSTSADPRPQGPGSEPGSTADGQRG